MASLSFHFCVLVFCVTLLFPTSCHSHFRQAEEHVAFFIFGDSLLDPGNNNYINTTTEYQANFWPYGETFFRYPTGRFSDGRLIPDFIAKYAKLPLIPSFLQPGMHQFTNGVNFASFLQPGMQQFTNGVNFASGGAGALVETHSGMVINLKTQLSYFKNVKKLLRQKLGDAQAKKLLSRAVYLFSIGGNDYIIPFTTSSGVLQSYSPTQYVEMVIGNLTTVIKEIYKEGGRKFGLLEVGPLGCLPGMRVLKPGSTGGRMEEMTVLAKLHNRALSKVLQKLESQLKGFKYSKPNFYTSFSERIDYPSKFGFKDGKMGCCGTGPYRGVYSCGGKRAVKEYQLCVNASEYLFFDSVHPSERANQQFAEQMWSGGPSVTGPYNLKALFERTHG